ncbi:hypothetical protein ACLB2K_009185 [Fragaria x ananassa]
MKSHRRIRHRKLNLMELLPMELLVDILKRVSAESVCRIRCVSKMLLSIVDSPDEPATYSDWSEGVARGKNFFYLTRRH